MTMAIDGSSKDGAGTERALRWIGDLDHPFYKDERNRFVWYEASAIAFQMFLIVNLFLVGAMAWIGGASALPYAFAVMVVNGVVAITATTYAERRYAEYIPERADFLRGRGVLGMALLIFVSTGFFRAIADVEKPAADGGFGGGFLEGAYWGMIALPVIVPVAVAATILLKRKRLAADEIDERDEF